jgi:hypothetical protein
MKKLFLFFGLFVCFLLPVQQGEASEVQEFQIHTILSTFNLAESSVTVDEEMVMVDYVMKDRVKTTEDIMAQVQMIFTTQAKIAPETSLSVIKGRYTAETDPVIYLVVPTDVTLLFLSGALEPSEFWTFVSFNDPEVVKDIQSLEVHEKISIWWYVLGVTFLLLIIVAWRFPKQTKNIFLWIKNHSLRWEFFNFSSTNKKAPEKIDAEDFEEGLEESIENDSEKSHEKIQENKEEENDVKSDLFHNAQIQYPSAITSPEKSPEIFGWTHSDAGKLRKVFVLLLNIPFAGFGYFFLGWKYFWKGVVFMLISVVLIQSVFLFYLFFWGVVLVDMVKSIQRGREK